MPKTIFKQIANGALNLSLEITEWVKTRPTVYFIHDNVIESGKVTGFVLGVTTHATEPTTAHVINLDVQYRVSPKETKLTSVDIEEAFDSPGELCSYLLERFKMNEELLDSFTEVDGAQ